MSNASKIIDAIEKGNDDLLKEAFNNAMREKSATVLEIKKVAVTEEFFNKKDK